MQPVALDHGVPQFTLEHYHVDFSDRHLLHQVVSYWAAKEPDRLAIIEHETGRQFSYAQFEKLARALSIALVELGFQKGDFLATSLPLLAEHVFLEYACFQIGVIHTPLDLRLKAPEVIRSLGLVKARGYVFLGKTPIADFAALGEAVRDHCPFVEHLLQFSPPEETIRGARSALALREQAAAHVLDPTRSSQWTAFESQSRSVVETDGAQVIYTTGSTGYPKPALLSHRNITCQNMCVAGGFGIDAGMRMLVNLPPSHVGCQAEQLMTTFFAGGTAVLLSMFDAEKSLEAIAQHRVDILGQIPAMYQFQWRLPNYASHDLSSLRFALYGGQQVTRPFLEKLSQMAPRFGTGLGLTELAGFVTYSPLDGTIDDILASVGFPMPVSPLSIRAPMREDGFAGAELAPGEVGEICFSGPQVFIDYVNDASAYRRTVSRDGIAYTGDLGSWTARGLAFAGRSKLVIKPKGYQVHPAQIEEHFAGHGKVATCAAVGVPHELYGEAVVLFVEPKPGADLLEPELRDHARQIAAYMRPEWYVFVEPGQFPYNRVAKTDYVVLKERAMAKLASI